MLDVKCTEFKVFFYKRLSCGEKSASHRPLRHHKPREGEGAGRGGDNPVLRSWIGTFMVCCSPDLRQTPVSVAL